MDIHQVLRDAWIEVEKADLPEALREAAFAHALSMLAGSLQPQPAASTPHPLVSPGTASQVLTATTTPAQTHPFEKFSEETGIERHVLESIYYIHDGEVGISLRAHKLGGNKAEQTRTLALLVFCARFFALGEDDVSVEHVRAVCEEKNCYDQANFSTTLEKAEGVNYTGPRGKKYLRLKSDTIDKFKSKVQSLTPGDAS